jgi:hypothetical protein
MSSSTYFSEFVVATYLQITDTRFTAQSPAFWKCAKTVSACSPWPCLSDCRSPPDGDMAAAKLILDRMCHTCRHCGRYQFAALRRRHGRPEAAYAFVTAAQAFRAARTEENAPLTLLRAATRVSRKKSHARFARMPSKHVNARLLIQRGLYDDLRCFSELEQRIRNLGARIQKS